MNRPPPLPLSEFGFEGKSSEEMQEIRDNLKVLLASEGWKIYYAIISSQQLIRFNQVVLNPLSGMDETFAQEYAKGEINGLRTAASLPQAIVESIEYDRELEKRREGDQE